MEPFLSAFGSSGKEVAFDPDSVARFLKESVVTEGVFEVNEDNCFHTAIFVGTTFATFFRWDAFLREYLRGGMRKVNPGEFPKILISYLSSYLAIELGIKGVNCTFSSGISSGWDAFSSGLYFLKRNKKNQLLVLELGERVDNYSKTIKTRMAFCILKNSPSLGREKHFSVLGSESFFEKAGENQGLIKAIRAVLAVSGLGIRQIDHFFSSRAPDTSGHKLEQEALAYFLKGFKLSLSAGESGYYSSGLFSLSRVLKSSCFFGRCAKKDLFIMVTNLGYNSNSSCSILRR